MQRDLSRFKVREAPSEGIGVLGQSRDALAEDLGSHSHQEQLPGGKPSLDYQTPLTPPAPAPFPPEDFGKQQREAEVWELPLLTTTGF